MLLYLTAILCACGALYLIERRRQVSETFLEFILLYGVSFAVLVEILSGLCLIEISYIRIATFASLLIAALIIIFINQRRDKSVADPDCAEQQTTPARCFNALKMILLFVILSATAYLALAAPTSNWDSMTYHLPRIEHWLQNKTLAYYFTAITRQLESQPFAEILLLNVRAFSFDRPYLLYNMVQWASFVGCIICCGLICGQLGGNKVAKGLSQIIAATLPMGILQAVTTQNDLVASFFILACAFFILKYYSQPFIKYLYFSAVAFALAMYTKGYAGTYIMGFVLVFGLLFMIKNTRLTVLKHVPLLLIIFLAVNCGHLYRSINHSGQLVGPSSAITLVQNMSLPGTIFIAAQNLFSNIPYNKFTAQIINGSLHRMDAKFGISNGDPRYSFLGMKFDPAPEYYHEDNAGNKSTLLLIIFGCFVLAVSCLDKRAEHHNSGVFWLYFLSIIIAFFCFSASIKWQPWITRLQCAGFFLFAPFCAVCLTRLKYYMAIYAVTVILAVQAYYPFFHNPSRPVAALFPAGQRNTEERLFANRSMFRDEFANIVNIIDQYKFRNISLLIGGDSWEFPLWYMLRERYSDEEMPVISHVRSEDISCSDLTLLIVCEREFNECPDLLYPQKYYNLYFHR